MRATLGKRNRLVARVHLGVSGSTHILNPDTPSPIQGSPKRSRRNRAMLVVIFPGLVLLWIVGWTLYWSGKK